MGGHGGRTLGRAGTEVNLRDETRLHATRLHATGPLAEGGEAEGSAEQAHRIAHVLRLGPGAALRLFNAEDGEFAARVVGLRRDRVAFAVEARLRPPAPEPGPVLAFALLKRDATDLVVQKATELGAAAIRPVLTTRTQAARVNLARLQAIAREAAEQCERLTVPPVAEPVPLTALLDGWPAGQRLAAAIERSEAPRLGTGPGAAAGGLLVGPEGGFTGAELDLLRSRPFVEPVSLGELVLRAETAALAGLALLRASPRL